MAKKFVILAVILLACSVRARSAPVCSVGVTTINFGNYTGTAIAMTGTVTVTCPSNTAYQIRLSGGKTGNVAARAMLNGTTPIGYGLFRDAAHATNWGQTDGVDTVPGTGTAKGQTFTVYGYMPAAEIVPVGGYNDQITVTISVNNGIADASQSFTVNSTMGNGCGISASNLDFGVYTGVQINATATISAGCTGNTTYNVGLSAGLGTGATVTNRSMTGPASTPLYYSLRMGPGCTQNWGNTVGTDTMKMTGNGTAQSLTVCGQIPPNQQPLPQGNYTDTIIATITY